MSKKVKDEWKQYLLDEEKDYSVEQLIEKFKYAVSYLKSHHLRIVPEMFTDSDPDIVDEKYHLSDKDKEVYAKSFEKEGYAPQDCKTIIKVMDAVYHVLDISKEEARQFTLYIAENHLTLTDVIERKYGLSLKECNEYKESILLPYADYYAKKVIQEGWTLMITLAEIFSDTE